MKLRTFSGNINLLKQLIFCVHTGINHFMKFSTMEDIDRRAVMQLIRSIRVMGKDELHIEFNYQDEYQKAISLAEQIATKNEERMVS